MTSEFVISIAERSIWVILLSSGPLLIVALLTGLGVSIFQATTQIQEQTLAFVPKIIAVMVAIVFFGPWMLSRVTNYASDIFSNLSRYIG
ncbi:flagellar biosynthetic protein FliQ [Sporosarcina sp. PTS2304]|uniref:flagellar biosynthesis protein FliQ n=1 Tax=Sporosarcina sp. PTS2304 TaxID=2283194 RepID=UPI000E0CE63E|nr:flagellar biosynthesis protein FliQ [Sporosarcina sp. PTS2304]AXH98712.1 flagellar biosynthetic protein FliQ [Sporosarcina sp. PTS2304]